MAIDLQELASAIGQLELRFRVRRRTAADWTALNEVLLSAEIGLETDTGKIKIGDGVTPWNGLAYFTGQPNMTLVAGAGIVIDDTEPAVPVVINDGVRGLIAGAGVSVDATDPHNPVISASGGGSGGRSSVTHLAVSSSGPLDLDYALGDYFVVSLSNDVTLLSIINPPAYCGSIRVRFIQDTTGNWGVVLSNNMRAIEGSDTSISPASSSATVLHLTTDDGGGSWQYSMKGVSV